MLDSTTSADKLCKLNEWDRQSLRISALRLGLKYRQLDVTESALENLDASQSSEGCKILVDFLKPHESENNSAPEDRDFMERVLHIAMSFIGKLILYQSQLAESILATQEFPLDISDYTFSTDHQANLAYLTRLLQAFRKQMESIRRSFPIRKANSISAVTPLKLDFEDEEDPEVVESVTTKDLFVKEIENSFPPGLYKDLYQNWKRKLPHKIIQDALIKGVISTALAFLENQTGELALQNCTLSDFFEFGDWLIYHALLYGRPDIAKSIDTNLGRSFQKSLTEVLLNTSVSSLRHTVIPHLEPMLTKEVKESLEYLQQLENLYPNPSFVQTFKGLSLRQQNFPTDENFNGRDLPDIPSQFSQYYLAQTKFSEEEFKNFLQAKEDSTPNLAKNNLNGIFFKLFDFPFSKSHLYINIQDMPTLDYDGSRGGTAKQKKEFYGNESRIFQSPNSPS